MAISGGIKFLKESKNKDASATSSVSGSASVANLLDQNKETFWRSAGSDDTTTEEIIIEFSGDKTIDRLFLIDMNLKDFTIEYDLAATWTDFANVVGIDGSMANITETAFAQNSAYYEFDSVTTGKIRIQATKTQTADEQKYINQVASTEELGTFVGYPEVSNIILNRNQKNKVTLNGKFSIQKSLETFAYKLKFIDYPSLAAYNADIDLLLTLMESEDPFLVWLCGGRYGSSYFKYTLPGFRLKDLSQMGIMRSYNMKYSKNIYTAQVNITSVDMAEVIG